MAPYIAQGLFDGQNLTNLLRYFLTIPAIVRIRPDALTCGFKYKCLTAFLLKPRSPAIFASRSRRRLRGPMLGDPRSMKSIRARTAATGGAAGRATEGDSRDAIEKKLESPRETKASECMILTALPFYQCPHAR